MSIVSFLSASELCKQIASKSRLFEDDSHQFDGVTMIQECEEVVYFSHKTVKEGLF